MYFFRIFWWNSFRILSEFPPEDYLWDLFRSFTERFFSRNSSEGFFKRWFFHRASEIPLGFFFRNYIFFFQELSQKLLLEFLLVDFFMFIWILSGIFPKISLQNSLNILVEVPAEFFQKFHKILGFNQTFSLGFFWKFYRWCISNFSEYPHSNSCRNYNRTIP